MKIICSRNDLIQSINIVGKAVPTRTTLEILYCILIDASTPVIRMTANDMELAIETVTKGNVVEKGIIALYAKLFTEIVRKLPENDVKITCDEKRNVTISCDKAGLKITMSE